MARILVVEDDPGIARVLVDYFETIGYSVAVENDGQHALQHVDQDRPDAIILDLMLPIVNGAEAARRLRRRDDTADIPIIAITAVDGSHDLEEVLMVDELIPKPFDLEYVASRVGELLDQQSDGQLNSEPQSYRIRF